MYMNGLRNTHLTVEVEVEQTTFPIHNGNG